MSLLKRIGNEDTAPAQTTSVSVARERDGQLGLENGRSNSVLRDKAKEQAAANQVTQQEKVAVDVRSRIQERLITELERKRIPVSDEVRVRATTEDIFSEVLSQEQIILTIRERTQLLDLVLAEIQGFGPIQRLLNDDTISEIMINGPKKIYVERKGRLQREPITFTDNEHVMRIIERIVAPLGRRVDESSPLVDARLPDGSRVNIVIPPIALNGPTVTIRKFSKKPLTIEDLIKYGSMNRPIANFLEACVKGRLNIVVSGGTGSGKTTLLNVLSSFIPDDERIITVENAAELQLRQEHVITLESKPANIEGKGEITIRDLVINCLRMRPERIVVGECRGGEALDMLQAMNTGHDGSLTTAHSNSPKDTISRLETMCLMAGMDLPIRAIRDQIASAVQLVVHQERMRDGTRKIISITEIDGMEGDVIKSQEIFRFEQNGVDENGKVIGQMRPTGVQPRFLEKFEERGIYLPPDTFGSAGMQRAF